MERPCGWFGHGSMLSKLLKGITSVGRLLPSAQGRITQVSSDEVDKLSPLAISFPVYCLLWLPLATPVSRRMSSELGPLIQAGHDM